MFTEERIRPVSQSTTDGTATPTAAASPAARDGATSWATSASALLVSVGSSTGSRSVVPSSTRHRDLGAADVHADEPLCHAPLTLPGVSAQRHSG